LPTTEACSLPLAGELNEFAAIQPSFVVIAMTLLMQLCPELRSPAPDAAQRYFSGALQSRGPCLSECLASSVPAQRSNAHALQRVRDTN